jgi:hypothetical protein
VSFIRIRLLPSEAQVSYDRHAQYTLGDYTAAAAAFRRGLELDPSNANLKSGLSNSEERISTDDGPPPLIPDENFPPAQSPSSLPNAGAGLGNMADMLGEWVEEEGCLTWQA